eukprot:5514919-Prymnesium_polylepis.1
MIAACRRVPAMITWLALPRHVLTEGTLPGRALCLTLPSSAKHLKLKPLRVRVSCHSVLAFSSFVPKVE